MIQVGDKFNLLTVKSYSKKDSYYRKYWICQCDCGNFIEVRGDKLTSNHTKSCGCLNSSGKINNILGQTFNNLTVIEQTPNRRSGGDVVWKCRCKCGNITYASASELRNNRIKSCGCLHSIGENEIEKILLENNILYKKEYCFSDLKDKGFLRFDFAILNKDFNVNYLIEFDGEIHFKKTGWSENSHKDIVYHDRMKNEYCLKNHIPLIRIPYQKRHNIHIEDLQLETSNYLLK